MSILTQASRLRHFATRCLDQLLPGSCLLCGQDPSPALICADCAQDLPPAPAIHCPICAQPTSYGERCGSCLQSPPHFDSCTALFSYEFPVDRLIQSLKYGHQLACAHWMACRLAEQKLNQRIDRVIPLPLHPERIKERGFNQSAEIARHLSRINEIPLDLDSLQRTRPTLSQTSLTPKQRSQNVIGAFECRRNFNGAHVLLIDDVLTSGATANECARILKLHGADSVHIAVAARAFRH